jgi:hypothetical protein
MAKRFSILENVLKEKAVKPTKTGKSHMPKQPEEQGHMPKH